MAMVQQWRASPGIRVGNADSHKPGTGDRVAEWAADRKITLMVDTLVLPRPHPQGLLYARSMAAATAAAAAASGDAAPRTGGSSVVVLRADTGTLIYYACSQCHKTLNKKLRPGPGGRLAATQKYATCTHCSKRVLPRPTFMLPLIVAGVLPRDGLQPRKLIALDETAERLFGCTAEEFSDISARYPSMASLIERLLEGRRFWTRTKENRKRQRQGQEAAAIITELLSLDPAPPLVASASALLRDRGPPAPAARRSRGDADSPAAWRPAAGGACLVYKFHKRQEAAVSRTNAEPKPENAVGSSDRPPSTHLLSSAVPSTPHVAGAIRRSRVFDPVDGPSNDADDRGTKRTKSASLPGGYLHKHAAVDS